MTKRTHELLSGELLTEIQFARAQRIGGPGTRFSEPTGVLMVPVASYIFFYNGACAWREPNDTEAGVGMQPLQGKGGVPYGNCGVDTFLAVAKAWKTMLEKQPAERPERKVMQ